MTGTSVLRLSPKQAGRHLIIQPATACKHHKRHKRHVWKSNIQRHDLSEWVTCLYLVFFVKQREGAVFKKKINALLTVAISFGFRHRKSSKTKRMVINELRLQWCVYTSESGTIVKDG